MHIALAGHIATENIAPYLSGDVSSLPDGYFGAPLMGTLIGELLRRGHRVSAFTTSDGMEIARDKWIEAGHENFRIYYCSKRPHSFRPKHGYLGRANDFFSVERAALTAAIAKAKPDVVHGHWSYEFGLAAIASGLPHIVTCHDAPAVVLRYMPNLYRLVRYFMARQCLRRAKVVTAVSPYLRDCVQQYCNVPVQVVQNPLPDFVFRRPSSVYPHEEKSSKCQRIAMVINGWGALKNAEPALKAFKLLRSRSPQFELHLFGADFGPGQIAEKWSVAAGIREGVHFHGPTSHRDLLGQLETMDLLLHPALEESLGMGIAEAMALGLPVVGGQNSGAVPWVIGDGGVTTDVTSPEAIVSAIEHVFSDDDARSRYIERALFRSKELFSSDIVADLYEAEYQRAIALYRNDA